MKDENLNLTFSLHVSVVHVPIVADKLLMISLPWTCPCSV